MSSQILQRRMMGGARDPTCPPRSIFLYFAAELLSLQSDVLERWELVRQWGDEASALEHAYGVVAQSASSGRAPSPLQSPPLDGPTPWRLELPQLNRDVVAELRQQFRDTSLLLCSLRLMVRLAGGREAPSANRQYPRPIADFELTYEPDLPSAQHDRPPARTVVCPPRCRKSTFCHRAQAGTVRSI